MKTLEDYGIKPDPVIEHYKKDVDRTLLRENLKLTVQERFDRLIEMQRLFEELRAAGHKGPLETYTEIQRAHAGLGR